MRYDQVFAKNGHVLLRYTAEGDFKGVWLLTSCLHRERCADDRDVQEPYMGIEANGNHARWSAAAIFEVENGKIKSFTKDWDQKVMQIQLGWAPVKDSDNPRWNVKALADPEGSRRKH